MDALCLIEDPDEPTPLLAVRRPDRSAVVVSVTCDGGRQRFGDLLLPVLADDAADALPRYRTAAVLRPGGHRTDRLVVPHPGERSLLQLSRQIAARGWGLAVTPVAGVEGLIELWLATPAPTDPIELDALLGALTVHWSHPPAYPDLAARAGGDMDRHCERAERYADPALPFPLRYPLTARRRPPAAPRRW